MVNNRVVWMLVTVLVIVAIIGCTSISVLSGPRTLSAGDTATYVLSLGGDLTYTWGWEQVVAEVPESWSLLSNSYKGTINGQQVSGSGTLADIP